MLNSTQLKEIRDGLDQSKPFDPQTLRQLAFTIEEREACELRQAEDEERRRQCVPEVVPNFANVPNGTLVVRSEHWKKDRCKSTDQIGMLVDTKIMPDDLNVASYWPVVHWEGEMFSSMTHPLLVALKSGEALPTVTINANQQVKK